VTVGLDCGPSEILDHMPRAFEQYNAATTFVDEPLERGWGDRIAFVQGARRVTYHEFAELTNRTGNVLRELGVEMEQRVMLLLYDSPEFACSFFGAIKIGAVAVPVSTLLRAEEYAYYLNDSRARVLVAHEPLLAEIEPVVGQLTFLKHIVVVPVGMTRRPGAERYQHLDALVKRASSSLAPAETVADDAAFWLYTSGSTGLPKAAVHRQHDMLYCADTVARHVFAYGPEDRAYSVSKLTFAYGLGNGLYFPLRFGAAAVHDAGRPTPESIFETIQRYRPTLVFTVPTIFARLLAVEDAPRRYDLSSVRMYVSSGEPLPEALFHRWEQRFGATIFDVVGSTENLHDFLANRPGYIRPGSSGVPVPGYECRIVDDAGEEVTDGQAGHLLVKGGSTASCYWNNRQASQRTMLGEWLRTGDMFVRDAEGFYWYCGRDDDMFKVGGLWVSPHEVENALLGHRAVLEAAVVAVPDEHGLLRSKAYVVLKDGEASGPEVVASLQALVKERLAPHKTPRWIECVPDLPKTATGKIQRFRLRPRTKVRAGAGGSK
jgi:benzoate-CoA ligase family protein